MMCGLNEVLLTQFTGMKQTNVVNTKQNVQNNIAIANSHVPAA